MNCENSWGPASTVATDWSLQQMAPYIGRMKTSMARSLIQEVTSPGDLLVDPFCGCGVLPYEAAALKRKVVAGDWNPYGILLTRAKLFAPPTLEHAIEKFDFLWHHSRAKLPEQDLRKVPSWVRSFFHKETLRNALAFRDACVELRCEFFLACLLGILHHQRPGFLSFPSSHLVPYLRNRKFPRSEYPALYGERDVKCLLTKKIYRLYKRTPPRSASFLSKEVYRVDARSFPIISGIRAIITSPPYMNELDYVRDNRLRLWFINRALPEGLELPNGQREHHFRQLLTEVCSRLSSGVVRNGFIVLVLGDVTRRSHATAPEQIVREIFAGTPELSSFSLVRSVRDMVPDIRRSRRECRGTREETVLFFKRS
jgi:Putative RNA methylase family UPF0020